MSDEEAKQEGLNMVAAIIQKVMHRDNHPLKMQVAQEIISVMATQVDPALQEAAAILRRFREPIAGEHPKLEEWQACYAQLFTQMNDILMFSDLGAGKKALDLLKKLVELKKHKDVYGVTEAYRAEKNKAWADAEKLLEGFKS